MQLIQGLSLETTRWFQACSFLKLPSFWTFLHVNDPCQCYEKWKESCVKSSQQMPSVAFLSARIRFPFHLLHSTTTELLHPHQLPPLAVAPFLEKTSSWTLTLVPLWLCPRPHCISPLVPAPVYGTSPSLWAFTQTTELPIFNEPEKEKTNSLLPAVPPVFPAIALHLFSFSQTFKKIL